MTCAIGLDLGTKCGWVVAFNGPGGVVRSGTWKLAGKAGHDSHSLRYMNLEKKLTDLLALSPDIVFYELVRAHRGIAAAHMYGAFAARMKECCDKNNIPYVGLEVGSIKKFITGKGNAGKDVVIAHVINRGYKPKDDNEADAIALTLFGLSRY